MVDTAGTTRVIDEKDIMVPTRHGRLAVRIYRPDAPGRYPTLFAASPYRYDNDGAPATALFPWQETGPIAWYVERGYAYVRVDVLGTGCSEGEFGLLDQREAEANYDVIEWIAQQSWSNGKVGGFGQSYYCMSQWRTAVLRPPHLTCLGAYDGLVDPYFYFCYSGGIEGFYLPFWYSVALLPANKWPANRARSRRVSAKFLEEAFEHPTYDDFWRERSAREQLDQIDIPVFSIGAWAKHELHCGGNIEGFQRSRGPAKLHITGTPTVASAHADFAREDFHEKLLLPFYERHLKGITTSHDQRSTVAVAVLNSSREFQSHAWPPNDATRQVLHLGAGSMPGQTSAGTLNAEPASAAELTHQFPDPGWSVAFGSSVRKATGFDHGGTSLTFTSAPLESDFYLVGRSKLVVHCLVEGEDLDLLVKLCAVRAEDPPVVVTRGWLRASFRRRRDPDAFFSRSDFRDPEPLLPGETYELEVPMEEMAYRFPAGTRLALEICTHDTPLRDRQFAHIFRADKQGRFTLKLGPATPSRLVMESLDPDSDNLKEPR